MSEASKHGDRRDQAVVEGPVDINRASREELRMVRGLGDGRVEQILECRDRNGPFESVDDLQHLPLFGPDIMSQLRPQLKV